MSIPRIASRKNLTKIEAIKKGTMGLSVSVTDLRESVCACILRTVTNGRTVFGQFPQQFPFFEEYGYPTNPLI